MNEWIGLIVAVTAVVLAYVAVHFGWIDLGNKSRSAGSSGALGIGDEIFNPTRHEAQIELDRQTVLPAPAPLAGDPSIDTLAEHSDAHASAADVAAAKYRGSVQIDLNDRRV